MKFTLRDLLWLTLVLAIAFSWFNSDRKRIAESKAVKDRYDAWIEGWRTETAEIIEGYRKAAMDPVAYQEFLYRRNQEVVKAQQARAVQSDDEN